MKDLLSKVWRSVAPTLLSAQVPGRLVVKMRSRPATEPERLNAMILKW